MNRNSHTHTALSALILATAFAVGAAYAQVDNPPKSSTATPETHEHQHTMASMGDTSKMSGMHDMPATVTSVDQKTGIVGVESEGMKLKVHFPTNTIADLKKGDKIKLHLGYSKE
jgi:hypothetical protein